MATCSNPFTKLALARLITTVVMIITPAVGLTAAADEVDFEKEIWPIFQSRCNDCHNGDSNEGQLRLDAKVAFEMGGVSGKLTNSSNLDKSLLLTRLLGQGDLDRMPLDDDPLTDQQIKKVRAWIGSGAKWPKHVGVQLQARKKHWAYIKPQNQPLPADHTNWGINAVDRFVLAKWKKLKLKPSPAAPRGKLLRRLYLDLIGVPPTLDELKTFLADDHPDAYERKVDQLLASPLFGTKWSRSWLDLARYADTNGFQADQFRSVWPYRDWVINSMNQDQPFDQFTIEQLAGDLIPNATLDQKIATGFHRLTTCNVEAGVDPEQNRTNQIIDRINTTGTVWFGTTFECMQCHNHKYDPFTQREYYEMFAFFNNTPLEVKNSGNDIQYEFYGPKMDLPLSKDQQHTRKLLSADVARLERELTSFRQKSKPQFETWLAKFKSPNAKPEPWRPLTVVAFRSSGGATHQLLDDQSVLLSGKNPDKDLYTVVVETDLAEINGFKFETLTHGSLPSNGPGRQPEGGRPNFVLYEIKASLPDSNHRGIELHDPIADFSQKGWSVNGLVDGKNETGWAINPQFGKNHWASVLTKKPLKNRGKSRIQFTFDQHYGGGRNIGRLRISALVGSRAAQSVPSDIQKLLAQTKKLSPKQREKLEKYYLGTIPAYQKLTQELATAKKTLDAVKPNSTLVMVEAEKRMTAVFKRGDFLDPGEKVKTSTPSVLHSGKKGEQQNRLDFANWIVDANNPLTARVVVNRWWTEIFGRGIVVTGEDFGTQGEPPSHPQLLDWLAMEFIDSGWSRKHIIKTIVLSQTYRQSSDFDAERYARDPHNVYLARGPRFRLSAELIRDNLLVVTDSFSANMDGPPVYPPQPEGVWRHVGRNEPKYTTSTGTDRFRRGIYVFWRRSAPYPSFVNFDAPDRASCVVNRGVTNTPLQALTLLNDSAFYELAVQLATRLQGSNHPEREKLQDAFMACTMREPTKAELDFLLNFLNSKRELFTRNSQKADAIVGGSPDAASLAAWVHLAQILLNLDETITKD